MTIAKLGHNESEHHPPQAIILAAGLGKRMGAGDVPKVICEAGGRPMICWVVDACQQAGVARCVIIIGHKGHLVQEVLADYAHCAFVEQTQLLGTGHATQMAEPLFANAPPTDVFVLAGDGPLVRPRTLIDLLQTHRKTNSAVSLATAVVPDPTGYGRIVRDRTGRFQTIVEQKDASEQQKLIKEINPTYYCFASRSLFPALHRVKNDNKQGEYYLTDVPALLMAEGQIVTAVNAVPPEDALGVNTPEPLAQVDRLLRARLNAQTRQRKEPA